MKEKYRMLNVKINDNKRVLITFVDDVFVTLITCRSFSLIFSFECLREKVKIYCFRSHDKPLYTCYYLTRTKILLLKKKQIHHHSKYNF